MSTTLDIADRAFALAQEQQNAPAPQEAPAPEPAPAPEAAAPASVPEVPASTAPAPEAAPQAPSNPHIDTSLNIADTPEGGDKTPKAINSWQKAKATIKEQEQALKEREDKLAALAQELEDARKSAGASAEAEELRAKLKQAEDLAASLQHSLKAADYTRTPEYAKTVREPEQNLSAVLTRIAESGDLSPKVLWDAITESDPKQRSRKIEEATSALTTMDKLEVATAAKEYQRIQGIKARLDQESEALWSENERAQKEQIEQAHAKFREEHSREALRAVEALQAKHRFLRKAEGAQYQEWNAFIDAALSDLRVLNPDALEAQESADLIAKGKLLPLFERMVEGYAVENEALRTKAAEEIKALKEELQKYRDLTPSAATHGQHSQPQQQFSGDMADRMVQEMQNLKKAG